MNEWIQLDRFSLIHSRHLVYRDVKPDNFCVGRRRLKKDKTIFVIDFGLSKEYIVDGAHIMYRSGCNITGTVRYISINTHQGIGNTSPLLPPPSLLSLSVGINVRRRRICVPRLSTTNSWLNGNAAVVSGLSAVTYFLTSSFGNKRSSGTQTFLTESRHGNLNFRPVIYFRFRSGICFRSDFYIRDSGGTTASPCPWPENHGRGRFCACHYGCRSVGSVSRAARWEADSHGRLLRPTLPDADVSMTSTEIRYLLDSKSMRLITKTRTSP